MGRLQKNRHDTDLDDVRQDRGAQLSISAVLNRTAQWLLGLNQIVSVISRKEVIVLSQSDVFPRMRHNNAVAQPKYNWALSERLSKFTYELGSIS